MDQYGEIHRILVTYVRAVRTVPADVLTRKAEILGAKFGLETEPQVLLRDLISTINVNIEKLGFKIDVVRDQDTSVVRYVFVNTRFDEFIQGCTAYTPAELDAIKHLIDSIVESREYAYSVLYAMAKQQTTAVLKQRTSDAVVLLRRLVEDGWFEMTDLDRMVLSLLCLAELRTYLDDKYGVLTDSDAQGKLLRCNVCEELATMGRKCRGCHVAFHHKCYTVYERGHDQCPNGQCRESIRETVVVGPN